jgi:saccharopine dehydrogenase (NAD+, L-lysine-forming)
MPGLTYLLNATSKESLMIQSTKRKSYVLFYMSRLLSTRGYRVGCKLVDNNTWPSAPVTTPIIGLKELPESDEALPHTHIQFAHCYKGQAGWSSVLARFNRGGGTLYDLEFLTDASGRRVAAFGFHAGFAGAAAGALALASQKKGEKLGRLEPYANEEAMVSAVKRTLGGSGKGVKALVIGALGRCGRGAVDLFRKIGLEECVVFDANRDR